jgi:phosphoglucomutase
MITASHNPKEYNGYKVYGDDGAQMSPENTQKVVKYIDEIKDYFSIPYENIYKDNIKGWDNQKINDFITVIGQSVDEKYYEQILKLSLSPDAIKAMGKELKLVYTPIHGSGYKPVMTVFERMGINAALVQEQAHPDTEFSTVEVPNPENEDALRAAISLGDKIGADVVIGTDPDCDRMGLAVRDKKTNKLKLLNGNQIGILLLDYILTRLKSQGKLSPKGAVVKTIVTTSMVDAVAKDFQATVFDVLTGFKFIGEKIKEWEKSGEYEYIFGFEESYGYLRGTHARDKDAVVACMLTAEMACYYQLEGKNLYDRLMELFEKYGYYHELNDSIVYKGVEGMRDMALVMKSLRQKSITRLGSDEVIFFADYKTGQKRYIQTQNTEKIALPQTDALYYGLKDGQFVCIRPSGTEPKLKIYVLCRAKTLEESDQKAQSIMRDIKKEL